MNNRKFHYSSEVTLREATLDDARKIDKALADARAIINCVGPFPEAAAPVVCGALRASIHYLDLSSEQQG